MSSTSDVSLRPTPTSAASTNTKAIVALPLALALPLVGLVFGVLALREIGRNGDGGKGLALAAVIIGAVALVLYVIGLVTFAGAVTALMSGVSGMQGSAGM